MSLFFEVTIPGPSCPQGSARAFVNRKTGKPIITSATKGLAAWRSHAVRCIHARMSEEGLESPVEGPVAVEVTDYRKRPKGRAKRHLWPDLRPDIDKIARATLDAIEASGLLNSDAQVCRLDAWKLYSDTDYVTIRLLRLE